ncbi:MAG: hypothetical protein FWE26_04415 [Coriobacteriia bacterium]|nr:hypothetical protein [Coriobacteriia bacterium]
MKRNRPIILTFVMVLLCVAIMGALMGCSAEDGEVGNIIDRTLWDMRGYPSQQEILERLEEKYGEEFGLVSLNPGARFFQGIAFPQDNPDLHFSLEMKDDEGNPVSIEYMRDDYQARLAEVYIEDKLTPVFEDEFGPGEIASLRIEVGLFDRREDASLPPVDFEWLPSDGLDALATTEDISMLTTIHLMLESVELLRTIEFEQLEQLAELIVEDVGIPLSGDLYLRAVEQNPVDERYIRWTVEDGQISEVNP